MKTVLKKDEQVVLMIRPHWLVLTWPSLIAAAGIVIGSLIGSYGLLIPLVLLCFLWYKVAERNNNLWAVTNLRVIDECGVFSRNAKESPLDKINNITYEQSVWGRIFGFGNVQIQTAAESGSTTYHMVEKPKQLKDTITEMQEEYKKAGITAQARELAQAVAEGNSRQGGTGVAAELEKLFELKEKGILSGEEYTARKKRLLDT